jgi:hypothetical protein
LAIEKLYMTWQYWDLKNRMASSPEFESLHSRFLSLNDFSVHLGHDYRKLAITVPARLGVRKNGVSLKPDASTGAFSVSVSFHVLMPQQFFKNQEV